MTQFAPLALVAAFAVTAVPAVAAGPAQKDIDEAVRRGVEALKKAKRGDGAEVIGPVAIGGLAMLEAGTPTDDAAVKKVTAAVRDTAVTETRTYQLALCLLYLDRLGEPSDRPLIQLLGVRLLAGQNADGGWTYNCIQPVPAATERELRSKFDLDQLASRPLSKPGDPGPQPDPAKPATALPVAGKLDNDIEKYGRGLLANMQIPKAMHDDNSNTQFAVLAVWVARRHGVPVENALALIEKRFLTTQTPDGGWPYSGKAEGSPSMTCAGLLGLAVAAARREERILKAEGARKPPAEKPVDPATANDPFFNPPKGADPVEKKPAAKRPANALDRAIEKGMEHVGAVVAGDAPAGNGRGRGNGRIVGDRDLYFWWSVERVGVVYGVEKLGGVEWYPTGAEFLLALQQADGSWGAGNSGANTAFAVLFLARSNLVRDLSAKVQRDPAVSELRTGPLVARPQAPVAKPPAVTEPAPEPKSKPDPTPVSTRPALPAVPAVAPPKPGDVADKLGADLRAGRTAVLTALRDGKGADYTAALAQAIPKLDGDARKSAREALAERLTRMTAATLREMLADKDAEVRRAAALAVGMKDETSLAAALIDRLDDPADPVARAARAALKSLADGTDFGPQPGATAAERRDAVAAWRAWWAARKK